MILGATGILFFGNLQENTIQWTKNFRTNKSSCVLWNICTFCALSRFYCSWCVISLAAPFQNISEVTVFLQRFFCNDCKWRNFCPIYMQSIISSSACMIFFLWSEHLHRIKLKYKLCLGDLHRDLSGTNTVGTEGIYPQSLCLLSYSSHVYTVLI